MEHFKVGEVRVEHIEGGILVHVSTAGTCYSFLLEPEEARELSSLLFSRYVEHMMTVDMSSGSN